MTEPNRDQSGFLRSTLALVSGTVASQGILFLFSPLLSRIFDPTDFSDLANYNAWVAMLSMLSNLRYEQAVIVAEGRAAVNRVMALALTLSLGAFVAYALAATAIQLTAPVTGYLAEIRGFVWLIALGTLPTVVTSLLMQLTIRHGNFKLIAGVSLFQVIVTLAAQVLLGVLDVSHGLVLGAFLGVIAACVCFLVRHFQRYSVRHVRREMTFDRLRATGRRFVNFPRYALGADAITVVVQQFVPVLLTGLFGPVVAGLYAFSTRVIRVPLLVIATAVGTVLRKEAVEHLQRTGNLLAIYRRTVVGLTLLAVGPFSVLMIFATQIFARVFGEKWVQAGPLVRLLAPGLMLEFIAFPLLAIFLVTQSQRYAFRIQLASIALLLAALVAGRYYWNSFLVTCALMSVAMLVTNGLVLLAAFFTSKPARQLAVESIGAVT